MREDDDFFIVHEMMYSENPDPADLLLLSNGELIEAMQQRISAGDMESADLYFREHKARAEHIQEPE